MSETIFISHRSTDKDIADMLVDFFSGTGIPRESVFCSSLPGNDISEKISGEVRTALKNSVINIAILSKNYYESIYCLNEAGVFWYQDTVPVIIIALPEIGAENMYGILNNEYKLRRLDSTDDIAAIYDTVNATIHISQVKQSIITNEIRKLKSRYTNFLKTRVDEKSKQDAKPEAKIVVSELTTDDECVVLYYILLKKIRKIAKSTIQQWLYDEELFDINIDNAFDLLSHTTGGTLSQDTLELGFDEFKALTINAEYLVVELKPVIERHRKLAADIFVDIWKSGKINDLIKLFIAYVVDERVQYYGSRWKAEEQVRNIIEWETKTSLDSTLSNNYGAALEFFIHNGLVYEVAWTSFGNPKEYSLRRTLREVLFNCPDYILEELAIVKDRHEFKFPF